MSQVILLVTFLVAPGVSYVSSRSMEPDDAVAKASAAFQQSAYEFALHLAMGESGTAPRQLQETWRQLAVLRDRACPAKLRRAVDDATHNLHEGAALAKRLDTIGSVLDALASELDVAEAREHLAEARAALKANELANVQTECSEVIDSVVGVMIDVPLVKWVAGLRKARMILGPNPSAQRMAQALDVLRALEGVERFRSRAFRDSLSQADEWIATASDLYGESDFQQAAQVLGRVEVPLQIAARASHDEQVASKLSELWQQLRQANELIVTDIDLARTARTKGFGMLDTARSEIAKLLGRTSEPSQ